MTQTPDSQPGKDIRQALRGFGAYLVELVRVVTISLAIILPIRYFLIQPFYVKGASMEPNFFDHEYLVIDELSYRLREPARGDIVVFRYPRNPRQFFIKRVVGIPGETVVVSGGKTKIINEEHPGGVFLDESGYLAESVTTAGEKLVKLGADEYYLLGDNRTQSLDSRIFGPVKREFIVGRVWVRGWPLDKIGTFPSPDYDLP